jgi:hypothetical protein
MTFSEKTNSSESLGTTPFGQKPVMSPCHGIVIHYYLPNPAVITSPEKLLRRSSYQNEPSMEEKNDN